MSGTYASDLQEGYWPTQSWREVAPVDQGMEQGTLDEMLEVVGTGGSGIDSLLVVRNGYIVLEK